MGELGCETVSSGQTIRAGRERLAPRRAFRIDQGEREEWSRGHCTVSTVLV